MITATVQNSLGEVCIIKYPTDVFTACNELRKIDVRDSPRRLRLTDREDSLVRIKLHSDSEIGKHLIPLLNEGHTLTDLNNLDTAVSEAREEIRGELEQNILGDQYTTPDELYRDIKEMLSAAAPVLLSFYCPLTANIHQWDSDIESIENTFMLRYQDKIETLLEEEQQPEDGDMATYLTGDDTLMFRKMLYAEWNVEELRGELYGRIDCYFTARPNESEIEELRDEIIGQAADGFGEHFEQQPIRTDEGDLYVSFWNSDDDYFMCTDEEMERYITGDIRMGGMT